jgi:general secretion pathway protein G
LKTFFSSRNRASRGAFTLIEMIIVLTIIGLLVGMAMYNLGDVGASAKIQKVKADLLTFKELLAEYQLDNGSLPTTDQGIKIFWTRPTIDPPPHWRALLDQETLDPWGHPYQFLNPGKHNPDRYDVWSLGPDGKTDTDDDIGNWTDAATNQP